MSNWKKTKAFSLRVDGQFKNQFSTREIAEQVAKKYIAQGKTISIKEIEVEQISAGLINRVFTA